LIVKQSYFSDDKEHGDGKVMLMKKFFFKVFSVKKQAEVWNLVCYQAGW
jgi:hypothetical protein